MKTLIDQSSILVSFLCKKLLFFCETEMTVYIFPGTPHLAVRSQLPLKPILPYEEATNPDFKVPKFTYVPESIGYSIEHRHGTNIPGIENI